MWGMLGPSWHHLMTGQSLTKHGRRCSAKCWAPCSCTRRPTPAETCIKGTLPWMHQNQIMLIAVFIHCHQIGNFFATKKNRKSPGTRVSKHSLWRPWRFSVAAIQLWLWQSISWTQCKYKWYKYIYICNYVYIYYIIIICILDKFYCNNL